MVEINDADYKQLVKDANDNKTMVKIARWIVGLIVFLVIFFSWGTKLIDLDVQRRTIELQNRMEIKQAETNRQIFSIESEGMTKEEYFKWLEVRDD